MEKYIKNAAHDDIEYLMANNFLVDSYKEIIYDILTNPDIEINDDKFSEYTNDYINAFVTYEAAKNSIIRNYISDDIFNDFNVDWSIDYSSRLVTLIAPDGICDILINHGWRKI